MGGDPFPGKRVDEAVTIPFGKQQEFTQTWKRRSSMVAGFALAWLATSSDRPGPAVRASQPLAHGLADFRRQLIIGRVRTHSGSTQKVEREAIEDYCCIR